MGARGHPSGCPSRLEEGCLAHAVCHLHQAVPHPHNPRRLTDFFAPAWHLGDNWHADNESDPWDPDQLRNQLNSSFRSLSQQNCTGFRKASLNLKLCNCKLNCTHCCDECRCFFFFFPYRHKNWYLSLMVSVQAITIFILFPSVVAFLLSPEVVRFLHEQTVTPDSVFLC